MTTNRMGLTPEMGLEISNDRIDDETLTELIEFRRGSLDYHVKQGNKTQALMHGAVLSALRELLAYREASKEPVADVVAWNKTGEERKCDIRWRRFDVAPGALFTAPPLQVAPAGWKLVPVEPAEDMVIEGFESEPDSFFSHSDEWEAYKAMSGCQQAAHKAKLCWAAMIAAAPSVINEP